MGYPFVILSIYIIVFFLLCLTCFSLDVENGGGKGVGGKKILDKVVEVENLNKISVEGENVDIKSVKIENVDKIILEGDNLDKIIVEVVNLNKKGEEGENVVNSGRNRFNILFNNCLSRIQIILRTLIKLPTYFFISGLSIDSFFWNTKIKKRSKSASIITSIMSIALLCTFVTVVRYSVNKLWDPKPSYVIGIIYLVLSIVNAVTEYIQSLFLRKLNKGKTNKSHEILFSIFGVALIIFAFSVAYAHVVYRLHSVVKHASDTASDYVLEFCLTSAGLSSFFILLTYAAKFFQSTKFGSSLHYIYNTCTALMFLNMARIDTIFSIILFIVTDNADLIYLLIPFASIFFISLYAYSEEENEKVFQRFMYKSKTKKKNKENGIKLKKMISNENKNDTSDAGDEMKITISV